MSTLSTRAALDERASTGPSLWSRFSRNRLAVVGLAILVALAAIAVIGPFLTVDPVKQQVQQRLLPPSFAHPFGTDDFGREILARVIHGARVSLLAGLASVAISLVGGATVGLVAGYFEGKIGLLAMAVMDLLLAIPALLLAISIAARLGPGLSSAMLAAGLVSFPGYARVARSATLAVKRREFTEAARASGASDTRIIARHILPNALTPLIVQTTIGVGNAILLVSALGFLGLGAQPPQPEWGRMLADAQRFIFDASYLGIFPGVAIALTVLGFNLAGDGLRDALDPRAHR